MNTQSKTNEYARREQAEEKKPYEPPRLEDYGDMRSLTLGGTPGVGESQGATLRKFKIRQ